MTSQMLPPGELAHRHLRPAGATRLLRWLGTAADPRGTVAWWPILQRSNGTLDVEAPMRCGIYVVLDMDDGVQYVGQVRRGRPTQLSAIGCAITTQGLVHGMPSGLSRYGRPFRGSN